MLLLLCDDCQQLHYVFIPDQLGAEAMDAVHVGDDLVNDKQGANRAGIDAWLWKEDVKSFEELTNLVLRPVTRSAH